MYRCIHEYIHIYVHIYIHIHIYIYIYAYVCIHIYAYMQFHESRIKGRQKLSKRLKKSSNVKMTAKINFQNVERAGTLTIWLWKQLSRTQCCTSYIGFDSLQVTVLRIRYLQCCASYICSAAYHMYAVLRIIYMQCTST